MTSERRSRLEVVIFEWRGNLHAYAQLVDPAPDRRVARRHRLASWTLEDAPEGSRAALEREVQRTINAWFHAGTMVAAVGGSASPSGDHRGV